VVRADAGRLAAGEKGKLMARVLQVAAIDFQVRHFLLPLVRALAARGHAVEIACNDGPLLDGARGEGFRVHHVPFARSLDLNAHRRAWPVLMKVLREGRYDVVHAHYPVAGQMGRLAARRAGVPAIAYTSHGYSFLRPGNPLVRAAMFAAEFAASRAQTVLFTQSTEEARLAERIGLAPKQGAIAIGNGVDPARFHPATTEAEIAARASMRAAQGATPDTCVIAIVARFVSHKGHGDLFRALRDIPNAHLWVVGDRLPSDHGDRLDEEIAAARDAFGPRLSLLGERLDVPDVLRAADVFALPSRFEGMPRSIIEAMMTALPCIGTNIRGTREEIVEGETGHLTEVGDIPALTRALGRLAADPGLRARMGAAGLARARDLYDEAKVIARQVAALNL
jgi:glycosyltransferase involved in cell wall biosynthesis